MEFYPFLTVELTKQSRILELEGLSQIFNGPSKDMFPWDIRVDAEALWGR